ncbi:hypothetical protein QUB76_30505 [Microcoleus sp. D2B6]|uniref:hypothetical protein n=1 Tax=Microcoleus sp. D2B6 TaxID=3055331 RepID=UPI002FD2B786
MKEEGRGSREEGIQQKVGFPTRTLSDSPTRPLSLLVLRVVVAIVQLKSGCCLVISSSLFVDDLLSSGIFDIDRL